MQPLGSCTFASICAVPHPQCTILTAALLPCCTAPLYRTLVPQPQYYDDEAPKVFYTGRGTIYSGTFTVTSRNHALKFKTGQMQLAIPTWTTNPDPEDYVRERAYVARNGHVSLEFFKSGEAY